MEAIKQACVKFRHVELEVVIVTAPLVGVQSGSKGNWLEMHRLREFCEEVKREMYHVDHVHVAGGAGAAHANGAGGEGGRGY